MYITFYNMNVSDAAEGLSACGRLYESIVFSENAFDLRSLVEDHAGNPACHSALIADPAENSGQIFKRSLLQAAVKGAF